MANLKLYFGLVENFFSMLKRGMGAIICLLDRKLYLRENLVALPLEYL